MDQNPPIHHRELVLPFAVAGCVGGWVTACCYEVDPWRDVGTYKGGHLDGVGVGWALILITPVIAALLGARIGRVARGNTTRALLVLIGAALLAGAANGAIVGLIVDSSAAALLVGILVGAVMSLPFVPGLAVILVASRRIGGARPRSLLDLSDRRYVWSATIVAVALSVASIARAWRYEERWMAEVLVGSGVPLLLALMLCDALAFLRARRSAKEVEASDLVPAKMPEMPGTIVDFGIGEGAFGRAIPGSYRLPEYVQAVFSGDPCASRRLLERRLAVSLAALALLTWAALATWQR